MGGRITIDSGACESVWPVNMVEDWEKVDENEEAVNGIGFVGANG